MAELTYDQHMMLDNYDQLLITVSEGLKYLEKNMTAGAPPQTQQVFEDLLQAFEQLSVSHEQMLVLFEDNEVAVSLIEDFYDIIKRLEGWFSLETNEEKRCLLVEQVVPAYESWRNQMQLFVKPYIAH